MCSINGNHVRNNEISVKAKEAIAGLGLPRTAVSGMDGSSCEIMKARLPRNIPPFQLITDNEYQFYLQSSIAARSPFLEEVFPCECRFREGIPAPILSFHELYQDCLDPEVQACGERSNCINRTLSIECYAEDCPCGSHCQNQRFDQSGRNSSGLDHEFRFQKHHFADVEVFETPGKGFGLRTRQDLDRCLFPSAFDAHLGDSGYFISEYVGEILSQRQFESRAEEYTARGHRHFYFMTLQKDQVIDATKKGNLSRFLNHSCNPNCATQKWIVNGKLRIGLFAQRKIKAGSELTFDYKYIRFGATAQPCLCGEANCKGVIGEEPKEVKSHPLRPTSQEEDDALQAAETFSPDIGLIAYDDLALLSRLLLRSEDLDFIKLLLRTLESTSDSNILCQFISLHGLQIINILMGLYWRDAEVIRLTTAILNKLPITTRNCIEDSSLEEKISKLMRRTDLSKEIIALCSSIHASWSRLEQVFRIPRASEIEVDPSNSATSVSQRAIAGYSLGNDRLALRKTRWNTAQTSVLRLEPASCSEKQASASSNEKSFSSLAGRKRKSQYSEATFAGETSRASHEYKKPNYLPLQYQPDRTWALSGLSGVDDAREKAEDRERKLKDIIERAKKAALERRSRDEFASEKPQLTEKRNIERNQTPLNARDVPAGINDRQRLDTSWACYEKRLRDEVSQIVVRYLSRWCRDQIRSSDHFKEIARKLTHRITEKEIRLARHMGSDPPQAAVEGEGLIDRKKRGKIKSYLIQYLQDHGYRISMEDFESPLGLVRHP